MKETTKSKTEKKKQMQSRKQDNKLEDERKKEKNANRKSSPLILGHVIVLALFSLDCTWIMHRASLVSQQSRVRLHCRSCRRHGFNLWVGEDPLEVGAATHSGILAWRIHGQRSLLGYSPQSHKESDMTEAAQHARMYVLCIIHTHIMP